MVPAEERREYPRVQASYKYFISVQGKTHTGLSRDVSPKGLGIFMDFSIEPGSEVSLRIFIPGESLKIDTKGQVVYCIENPDRGTQPSKYLVGVMVTEGLLEDLAALEPGKRRSRYTPSHTITINADARRCYELLADYERYPEWTTGVKKANVLERYPDGRGKQVEFIHDFFFRKVRYVLDYFYDDGARILSWLGVGGDREILTISGSYTFKQKGSGVSSATYELFITLSLIPSQRLTQYVTNFLMIKEMKNFKRFAEKNA